MGAIALHQAQPFCWGRYDCATFLGDCVWALTGVDPVAPHKPWGCPSSAARALLAAGCQDTTQWVRARWQPVAPLAASRGDVGWCAGERDRLQMPAVIVGAEAMSRNEGGFVVIPRTLLVDTYRIG